MAHGLKAQNFFPAVGSNGPAAVHVNLGQAGFVFIEANVKKWGLAPVTGSLAPPPPYGSEQGSILLETGRKDGFTGSTHQRAHANTHSGVHPYRVHSQQVLNTTHNRSRSGNFRVLPPTSPGPIRSPTDISLAHLVRTDDGGEPSGNAINQHEQESVVGLGLQDALNPPPDYTSPEGSEIGSRRSSTDSENTPLIRVINRSRQSSLATDRQPQPPIPTYHEAIRQSPNRNRHRERDDIIQADGASDRSSETSRSSS